jgi:ectoine hydroxylase-related dioxygenase (phytanoyl-CoA dioxygenase family)
MTFESQMRTEGWYLFPAAIEPALIDWMQHDLHAAYSLCRNIQTQNGVAQDTVGTVHHLPAYWDSYLAYLESMPIKKEITQFFGGPYILQSFGGNLNPPGAYNYASKIHRDVRSYSTERTMLNTLVMLDPFELDNGSIRLMPGSHKYRSKPRQEYFDQVAKKITGPAGSILVFDSQVWHAGGENRSTKPRRSVTPLFARPWIKQGLDYPRALGSRMDSMSEELKQVLGFYARTPASLEEWYRPLGDRFYRSDQG